MHDKAPLLGDALLVLRHRAKDLETRGWYRASEAVNENGNPVIYLNWSTSFDSGDERDLPHQLVVYDAAGNYTNDRSLFLGVISWQKNGDKLEKHYSLSCE